MSAARIVVVLCALALALPAGASAEPVVRGKNNDEATLVIVAGSAWAGSAPSSPKKLANWVAPYAVDRGYRVVSIATGPGLAGVESVRAAVQREAKREPTDTTCVYGESSGGHVAYLAAMQKGVRNKVDCLILGAAPTDLDALHAATKPKPSLLGGFGSLLNGIFKSIPFFLQDWDNTGSVAETLEDHFGKPPYPPQWSPVHLGDPPFDVYYLREVTDPLIPESQMTSLRAAVPGLVTKLVASSNAARGGDLNRVHAFVTPAVEAEMGNFIAGAVTNADQPD